MSGGDSYHVVTGGDDGFTVNVVHPNRTNSLMTIDHQVMVHLGKCGRVARVATEIGQGWQGAEREKSRAIERSGRVSALASRAPQGCTLVVTPPPAGEFDAVAGAKLAMLAVGAEVAQFMAQIAGVDERCALELASQQFALEREGAYAFSGLLNLIPVLGEIKMGYEAATGEDLITGDDLSNVQRMIGAFTVLAPALFAGGGAIKNSMRDAAGNAALRASTDEYAAFAARLKAAGADVNVDAFSMALDDTISGMIKGKNLKGAQRLLEAQGWAPNEIADKLVALGVPLDEASNVARVPIDQIAPPPAVNTASRLGYREAVSGDTFLARQRDIAMKNEIAAREMDALVEKYRAGNPQPGAGTKNLAGPIQYLRGETPGGGRVFFKLEDGEFVEVARSLKQNEQAVIRHLAKKYGFKL